MNAAILLAPLAMLGVWVALADVATRLVQPPSAMTYSYGTSVLVAVTSLLDREEMPALGRPAAPTRSSRACSRVSE